MWCTQLAVSLVLDRARALTYALRSACPSRLARCSPLSRRFRVAPRYPRLATRVAFYRRARNAFSVAALALCAWVAVVFAVHFTTHFSPGGRRTLTALYQSRPCSDTSGAYALWRCCTLAAGSVPGSAGSSTHSQACTLTKLLVTFQVSTLLVDAQRASRPRCSMLDGSSACRSRANRPWCGWTRQRSQSTRRRYASPSGAHNEPSEHAVTARNVVTRCSAPP